jgi:hypothetical protein
MASVIRTTRTMAFTSCTRTMSAPLAMAMATVAAVPSSRSSTGRSRTLLVGDTSLAGDAQALPESLQEVADDVTEGATALIVHDYRRQARLCRQRGHPLSVVAEAPDIVDHVGSCFLDRPFGDLHLVGVDADGQASFLHQAADNGYDALQLFICGYGLEVRTGGFASHVQDVLGLEAAALLHRRVHVPAEAIAGEGVRADVDHAHDVGAAPPDELLVADGDGG